MSHCHMVHTPVPIATVAITIPETKAAVDKKWTKLQKLRAWDESKVTSKAKVIRRAKLEGKTVHVATFVDLWHLKNSEFQKKIQKYKGRVVSKGDIVKGDFPGHTLNSRGKVPQRHI